MVKEKYNSMKNEFDRDFYENLYKTRYIGDDDFYKYSVGGRWVRSLIKKALKNIDCNTINNILDVGCGEGTHTAFLGTFFNNAQVLGVDLTDEAIKYARIKYNYIPNLNFYQGDFTNSNIVINKYAMVTCFDVLEHIEDWQSFLLNIINLSDKYIILTFPTGKMPEYEKFYGHLRNFKRGEVEKFLEKNNFKIVKTFYAGFPFYSPLGRWYLGIGKNFDNYKDNNGSNVKKPFTIKQKLFHTFLFILFRYFCFQNIGDRFLGLFERINITVNSNRGGK